MIRKASNKTPDLRSLVLVGGALMGCQTLTSQEPGSPSSEPLLLELTESHFDQYPRYRIVVFESGYSEKVVERRYGQRPTVSRSVQLSPGQLERIRRGIDGAELLAVYRAGYEDCGRDFVHPSTYAMRGNCGSDNWELAFSHHDCGTPEAIRFESVWNLVLVETGF